MNIYIAQWHTRYRRRGKCGSKKSLLAGKGDKVQAIVKSWGQARSPGWGYTWYGRYQLFHGIWQWYPIGRTMRNHRNWGTDFENSISTIASRAEFTLSRGKILLQSSQSYTTPVGTFGHISPHSPQAGVSPRHSVCQFCPARRPHEGGKHKPPQCQRQ